MNKRKLRFIGLVSILDLLVSIISIILLYYNMDIYFVPFTLFFFSKIIIFEILLIKDIDLNYFKTGKGLTLLGIVIVFFTIGIIKFYNLFAMASVLFFTIAFLFILFINLIKKNYKIIDVSLILIIFILNMLGYLTILLIVALIDKDFLNPFF